MVGRLTYGLPGLVSLVLYGSQARLDATAGSDADVLFIVDRRDDEIGEQIRENCSRVADRYSIWVSPQITDVREIGQWEDEGGEFWRNLRHEGVVLRGESLWDVSFRTAFLLADD